MSDNSGTSNNLGKFLNQIWGGISFVIGVVTCLLGLIQVAKGDLGLFTLILLLVGISALFLACVYYVWFWKPESEDESPKILIPDSDKAIKVQQVKQKRRKRIRRLARLGLFVIPILMVAGFLGWQYNLSLPPKDFIILVAKFDGPEPQEYRITETIIENLENATEEYSPVKIKTLEKSLNNSDNAKKEGKRQKAAIVIWGWYGKTAEKVPISVNFQILKSLPDLPELQPEARGQVQTLAVAQLESFQLQTRLSQEMTYLSLFTLGMYRYLEEDWDKAINPFSKALEALELKEEPVTALGQDVVYFYRGASDLQKESLQVFNDYSTLIQDIVFDSESGFLLSNPHLSPNKYQNVIEDFNRALKINPQFTEAYHNRGVVYLKQEKYKQAIEDFNRVIQINPQLALAYNNRGLAHFRQGNYQQAIKDFNRVIQINPQLALAYNNRGVVYLSKEKYQQAIEDFNRVIQINPQLALAYNNRGFAHFRQGNYQQAIEDFNQALTINPQLAMAYLNRGIAYTRRGDYQQAIDDYNQALKINPQFTEAYHNLGLAYARQRNYQQAIENFNRVIQINPQFAMTYNNRGVAYYEQGNYQQAINDYNQALKINPQFALVYRNRGVAYYEQGNYQKAIDDYNQAVKINSDSAEAKLALAVALYVRGEQERAFKMAEAALKLDRQFAELEYLQENLWGKRLLADAAKLLSTRRIQDFLNSNQP